MCILNENYLKLENNYLFSKISKEKENYLKKNKNMRLIDLSIGDVSLPLPSSCIDGIDKAKNLLANKETFTGYPPSTGHTFLKEEIIKNDYNTRGIDFSNDEVFISDSSKSDITNILDLFKDNLCVALQNPVYPVYVDSNILKGNKIIYITDIETFLPPICKVDLIYLCFPNNPTGKIISKETLKKYVDYATKNNALILFDSAYEAFIQQEDTVHSIYEIDGAKNVAIEFRSYSKTAGFTPIRLAYCIVPKQIVIQSANGTKISLNCAFKRLKDTKYNGPSFLSEYAIYNTYTTNKLCELRENISYYLNNVKLLTEFFDSKNMIECISINSPYVWIKTINNLSSWDFFYYMLDNFMILGTPGSGFGTYGDGYFRLTGFSSYEDTLEAIDRMKKVF